MKTIKFTCNLEDLTDESVGAIHSFIYKKEGWGELVGRKNKDLVLKIFTYPTRYLANAYIDNQCNSSFLETTVIQNIAARAGFAPRVYDAVLVEDKNKIQYPAQIVQYVRENDNVDQKKAKKKMEKFFQKRNIFYRDLRTGVRRPNMIAGKAVDFGSFSLPDEYKENLIQKAQSLGVFGSEVDVAYQEVRELGVTGKRIFHNRVRSLKFDNFDFFGKTVLDVGCNLGSFCMEADSRGAKRVVGVETKKITPLAFEINNLLYHFNNDFFAIDMNGKKPYEKIKKRSGLKRFDYVFYLSMIEHCGFPDELAEICKSVMFFEGHHGKERKDYLPILKKHFEKIDYLGKMSQPRSGTRPLFICYKKDYEY